MSRKLSIIRPGATAVFAPYPVGSMTTKGQMNPTSRVSLTASHAGENSQTNGCELCELQRTYDCIQNSNRPDLQKKYRKKSNIVGPTIEPAKQASSSNDFQILN
jgi:hypothetical protein